MDIDGLVGRSVKQNASDLHLCTGYPPVLRIDGELCRCEDLPVVDASQMLGLTREWLDATEQYALQQAGQVDKALSLGDGIRVRINIFQQLHGLSAALRPVPARCPELAALLAPDILQRVIMQEDGLILVTGATGSGKSTTLAALIDHLNRHVKRHIITLEDPIELIHTGRQCLIQQRELGLHTRSFGEAVRGALREDPDVLLLGELRDTEGIRLALTAAETGHLVLATLHARNATQAIDRLVDVFPAEEKAFVRAQLAGSLRAVTAQKLAVSAEKDGKKTGRVALFEVLTSTPAVCNLIREGKTHQLADILQTGVQAGMQTFAQSRQQRQCAGLLAENQE
ncbi:type IV pilus twitching motility protein PilT [Rahnella perminowiae]|uniref:type IV pilus twitching motility protein PilT n=1 Tax=Rahnella perminowiae TaxID=2816244 RepID=UPI00215BA3D9|nr:type IV pilus twitching motility protein PilT [Rahnella perminowiae]MCR9000129.1 type IV pilus twitching motility protein PilT [Rahnella perminowiae]